MPSSAAGSAEQGPAFSVSMRHAFMPFSGYFDDILVFFIRQFAEASHNINTAEAVHPPPLQSLFLWVDAVYFSTLLVMINSTSLSKCSFHAFERTKLKKVKTNIVSTEQTQGERNRKRGARKAAMFAQSDARGVGVCAYQENRTQMECKVCT